MERKAALLANFSQKDGRTPSAASSNRKASMLSLGVHSSSTSGAPRKQSSATLTLDQMLLNSSSHATDVSLDDTHRGCQDEELLRRCTSKNRKNRKVEVVKKFEVAQSIDPVPYKSMRKQTDSPQYSEIKHSYPKERFRSRSTLQDLKNSRKHEVPQGSMETTVFSKLKKSSASNW